LDFEAELDAGTVGPFVHPDGGQQLGLDPQGQRPLESAGGGEGPSELLGEPPPGRGGRFGEGRQGQQRQHSERPAHRPSFGSTRNSSTSSVIASLAPTSSKSRSPMPRRNLANSAWSWGPSSNR